MISSIQSSFTSSSYYSNTKENKKAAEEDSKTKEVIAKLEARDTEVRAHEAAHMGAGGGIAGSASFDYQVGPDRY
jgi:hypothetical protein